MRNGELTLFTEPVLAHSPAISCILRPLLLAGNENENEFSFVGPSWANKSQKMNEFSFLFSNKQTDLFDY
jgi:hypothetical protein